MLARFDAACCDPHHHHATHPPAENGLTAGQNESNISSLGVSMKRKRPAPPGMGPVANAQFRQRGGRKPDARSHLLMERAISFAAFAVIEGILR
jgi:hypothetical protein